MKTTSKRNWNRAAFHLSKAQTNDQLYVQKFDPNCEQGWINQPTEPAQWRKWSPRWWCWAGEDPLMASHGKSPTPSASRRSSRKWAGERRPWSNRNISSCSGRRKTILHEDTLWSSPSNPFRSRQDSRSEVQWWRNHSGRPAWFLARLKYNIKAANDN